MFSPEGPTVRELAVQALSSVERGYDLLAPKFDHTPFRTPDLALAGTARVLAGLGSHGSGLDLCCGTGAGVEVLRSVCTEEAVGVDFSAGMLEVARERHQRPAAGRHAARGGPAVRWVRGDARQLPFAPESFELVASFGALGHFLPAEWPGLFAGVRRVLRPGGHLVLPLAAPPRPGSAEYWTLYAFDGAMRVRNALWRPPFVMYYRTMRYSGLRQALVRAGFAVELHPLGEYGIREDGSPRAGLVVATRQAAQAG
ncbi:class I SAM-dependent methyltransferase [Streptomyces sp. P38-E01]|uniref:Class I SAM-dependent methyltransferase n=1 Tax=Streptomyces tardus TaxID=2780544 RepID=A0A949JN31_9ACTN|nr:class I SAM-dependent methyltransferase [Streptomyces tardus]MBU7597145.1 class I SAM-dependent methyltransferase [Streptomyces tardus]